MTPIEAILIVLQRIPAHYSRLTSDSKSARIEWADGRSLYIEGSELCVIGPCGSGKISGSLRATEGNLVKSLGLLVE